MMFFHSKCGLCGLRTRTYRAFFLSSYIINSPVIGSLQGNLSYARASRKVRKTPVMRITYALTGARRFPLSSSMAHMRNFAEVA
jgi:hypothetical protein